VKGLTLTLPEHSTSLRTCRGVARGKQINRSRTHTHTHQQRTTPPTPTHTHTQGKNNTPNPQTNISHKHLTTLESGATTGYRRGGQRRRSRKVSRVARGGVIPEGGRRF